LVEHGDLLSELKRVQEGLVGGFERELTTPNTLLRSRFLMDRAVTYITENFSRTIYIYNALRFNNPGSILHTQDFSFIQSHLFDPPISFSSSARAIGEISLALFQLFLKNSIPNLKLIPESIKD
jgi:hypothetical protein